MTAGRGIQSIITNASFLFGAQSVRALVRGIYAIILARYLGPELFGLFNYGQGWYLAFLPLTVLGVEIVLSREIGRDREKAPEIVTHTLALRSSLIIATTAVCGLTGWLLETSQEMRWLLLIFTTAMVGRSLAMWTNSVYIAYEKTQHIFRQESTFRVIEVVAGTVALLLGANVLAVASIHAVVWWLQAVFSLWVVHQYFVPAAMGWSWRRLKPLLKQILPLGLIMLCINWMQQGPLILFRHIEGTTTELGQLALALQAFSVLTAAIGSVGRASLPILSRTTLRRDGKDQLYLTAMLRLGFLFGATAGLIGTAFGPSIVAGLFGSAYTKGGTLLGPALWLLVPFICATATNNVLIAHRWTGLAVTPPLVGALIMTFSFPPLTSNTGALGPLLAVGGGMGVWALLSVYAYSRFIDVNWRRSILRPGVAVILGTATYWFLNQHWSGTMAGISSVLVLLGTAFMLGAFTKSELSAIGSVVQSFRRHGQ